VPANSYGFWGLANAPLALDGNQPTTLLNCVGVGFNTAELDFSVYHNDGAGAATKTPLGIAWALDTVYQVTVWCLPNAADVHFELYRIDAAAAVLLDSRVLAADLPVNTVGIVPHGDLSSLTAAAHTWAFFGDSGLLGATPAIA
jgi:hypothetical protein